MTLLFAYLPLIATHLERLPSFLTACSRDSSVRPSSYQNCPNQATTSLLVFSRFCSKMLVIIFLRNFFFTKQKQLLLQDKTKTIFAWYHVVDTSLFHYQHLVIYLDKSYLWSLVRIDFFWVNPCMSRKKFLSLLSSPLPMFPNSCPLNKKIHHFVQSTILKKGRHLEYQHIRH
jgi:hypothetical protein